MGCALIWFGYHAFVTPLDEIGLDTSSQIEALKTPTAPSFVFSAEVDDMFEEYQQFELNRYARHFGRYEVPTVNNIRHLIQSERPFEANPIWATMPTFSTSSSHSDSNSGSNNDFNSFKTLYEQGYGEPSQNNLLGIDLLGKALIATTASPDAFQYMDYLLTNGHEITSHHHYILDVMSKTEPQTLALLKMKFPRLDEYNN